jgi:hypothetical protein
MVSVLIDGALKPPGNSECYQAIIEKDTITLTVDVTQINLKENGLFLLSKKFSTFRKCKRRYYFYGLYLP